MPLSHSTASGNNLGLRGTDRGEIYYVLFFSREELITTFQNPIWICRTDLYQINQEMWNLKTRSWIKCWHHTAFQGQKKKNTFPYNLLCWVYRSTDTGIKNKPQHKKKKDARGVYLPSQSLKIELCQERLFLYVWDVTPELWRFSLHLLVRGNQPQSAKFIEEMYIKTSLCYN